MSHHFDNIEYAYQRFCDERHPLPTAKQVAELERRIDVVLPDDYREYLLQYNGGWFRFPSFMNDDDELFFSDGLRSMKGVGLSEEYESAELGKEADLYLLDDNIPPKAFIIGRTDNAYLIMLNVIPDGGEYGDYGDIVVRTFTQSILIASDIDDFFGQLRRNDEWEAAQPPSD